LAGVLHSTGEEEPMRNLICITGALLAFGLAVNAQDTTIKSETKTSGAQPKTVSYTGCVAAGTETKTYVLSKAIPVVTRETVGTTGTTTVSQSYILVPGPSVTVEEHVGHKVEVTGTMTPAGDSKTETKTKIDRDDGPDSKVKETTKSDNAMARFSITSIKDTGERCH
jgi:hypothetical protein